MAVRVRLAAGLLYGATQDIQGGAGGAVHETACIARGPAHLARVLLHLLRLHPQLRPHGIPQLRLESLTLALVRCGQSLSRQDPYLVDLARQS